MKILLTTWQRTVLLQAVGMTDGNAMATYRAGQAIRSLEFTEEERSEVNMRVDESTGRTVWDSTDKRWEVDIPDRSIEVVKSAFLQYRWPAAAYREVEAVAEQLGVKLDE